MGYIGQAPGLGIKRDFLFYATASQTSFSGVDANGMTLLFDPRTVIVYVNGIRVLKGVDYTVPNVSTIVFTTGLELSDEVAVDNFEAFSPANTYSKDEADTLLAKKLSVDLPQTFTELEKGQGRANIGADVLGGFRNKIINGDFDVWQRGTSLAAQAGTERYLADRWKTGGIGSTVAPSRISSLGSYTNGIKGAKQFHRIVVASVAGAGNAAYLFHQIEGVNTLAGRKATFTFYAKADAAKNVAVEFTQIFGSGGAPSAQVTAIGVTKIMLSTSFARYDVVVDIPDITAKTLGTDGNDRLGILIWLEGGSGLNSRTDSLGQQSGTFDIAHVSLVEGDATAEPDPFSPRHIQQELALCQRYYAKTYPQEYAPGSVVTIGALLSTVPTGGHSYQQLTWSLPVTMRATPSALVYPIHIANSPGNVTSDGPTTRIAAISSAGPTSITAVVNNIALGAHTFVHGQIIADAEL